MSGLGDAHVNFSQLGKNVRTLIITGEEDKVSPQAHIKKLADTMAAVRAEVLLDVEHWHVFENINGVAKAM